MATTGLDDGGRLDQGEDALLLREFAHRALNEFTVAKSAVSLAIRGGVGGLDLEALLAEAGARLDGVGHSLRLLARPVEPRVDLGAELVALCGAMSAARAGVATRVELDAPELLVDGAVARRVLLIGAELIANAFKHALAGRGGVLSVRLRRVGGEVRLDIAAGGDPKVAAAGAGVAGTGWGRGIMADLATMAGGSVSVDRCQSGTLARVRLPLAPSRGMAVGH